MNVICIMHLFYISIIKTYIVLFEVRSFTNWSSRTTSFSALKDTRLTKNLWWLFVFFKNWKETNALRVCTCYDPPPQNGRGNNVYQHTSILICHCLMYHPMIKNDYLYHWCFPWRWNLSFPILLADETSLHAWHLTKKRKHVEHCWCLELGSGTGDPRHPWIKKIHFVHTSSQ